MQGGCIDERNDLVHHFLPQRNRGTVDELRSALDALDEHHAAVIALREEFLVVLQSLADYQREAAGFM